VIKMCSKFANWRFINENYMACVWVISVLLQNVYSLKSPSVYGYNDETLHALGALLIGTLCNVVWLEWCGVGVVNNKSINWLQSEWLWLCGAKSYLYEKVKVDIYSLTTMGTHMPYEIMQFYLPSSRGDLPTSATNAGTRFSDPMQGWVDLVELVTYWGGVPIQRWSLIPVFCILVPTLHYCDYFYENNH